MEVITQIFDTSGFQPRWYCGEWSTVHGLVHIISDLAIFGAYLAIPCVLVYFVLRRRDVPFIPIFWLFGLFIFSCGFGHLVEATLFWEPWYRFSGLVKVITALASWGTVLALVPIVPRALALPGLATANERLQREMAERKRGDGARSRLAAIVESSDDAIYSKDLEGCITSWNRGAEKVYGYAAHEVLGKSPAFLYPDHPEEMAQTLQRIQKGERIEHFESVRTRKDGRRVIVSITTSPIHDETGRLSGASVIARDITERKEAEKAIERHTAELERSNRDLDQFAYSASHDLKAPLRAVDQLAQWVEEDSGPRLSEESRRDLQLMRKRLARMHHLLEDLLAYARAGRGRQQPEVLDTSLLVREVVELLALPAGFQVHLNPLPTLTTSRVPLSQVFRNLIGNAVKHHHGSKGIITISASEAGGWVEFVVEDDGPGIAPEYHHKIFQMFQTLKPRDQVEGSGMGLALVKKIVESRGGQVSVGSTPGNGAAFRFTWPRHETAVDENPSQNEAAE